MRTAVSQAGKLCYFGTCAYLLHELLFQEGSEQVHNVVDGDGRVQQV
jgi:hypothetical protein